MRRITKGLDVPIAGRPDQKIDPASPVVRTVALLGNDYVGMKPTMHVQDGDRVKLGQVLFEDKKTPGVMYTSPGAGVVKSVNRGAKRVFQSLIIELDGDDEETFTSYANTDLTLLKREQVVENLIASGLWTSLRTRPFSKVPAIDSTPSSIFVTAIDTNPLAPDPAVVIRENDNWFTLGLQVLSHLTDGKVFLCRPTAFVPPGADLPSISDEEFEGPHPAGLPGTHIHFLDPVGPQKTVWYIGYQDVIAVGILFGTGRLNTERVIAIAGPTVKNPTLVRTCMGASVDELIEGRLADGAGDVRVISGSVLNGRQVKDPEAFLGRYHVQVSILEEGREREFLGWQKPGFNQFSVTRVFASTLSGAGRLFNLTTSTGGSRRAMVPIGLYEKVMPLDIIPTFLLRSLIVRDTDQAQALGCLELDEDDVALCTFVCPGKYNYGSILRDNLARIEQEG